MTTKLETGTPRMELLRIEQTTGQPPVESALGWEEFLHLYALLRKLPTADAPVRGETMSKLLARGFEHRYAATLMTRATAGTQPLAMLVREAAVHRELKFLSPV